MNRLARRGALAVLVALPLACASGRADPADLTARLADMDEPGTFTMAYLAAGTDVLDCVQPNRSFTIDIDGDRFVVRRPAGAIAVRDGGQLRLHRSLFDAESTDAEWIETDVTVLTDLQSAALRRALGPDLAGYLLAADPPTSGLVQASSLAPLASSIEPATTEGDASTFRLTLDPSAYAEASGLDADATVVPPLVDITVTDERVIRVVVRPVGGEAAGGWTIDFPEPATPVPAEAAPGSTIDLGELAVVDLRAASIEGCAVGDEIPATDP